MVQRLFLDWIDTEPAASSVSREHDSVIHALPDETKSTLTFVQLAKARTEPALNSRVRQHCPPSRVIIGLRELCEHVRNIARKSDLAETRRPQAAATTAARMIRFHSQRDDSTKSSCHRT